ncbi:MAG: RtcB family protein [Chloroflexota bacterium]
MGNDGQGPLRRIDASRWELPMTYKPGMRVPGLIYADDKLAAQIQHDQSLEQVANVAFLPGIVAHSLAMPDIHWGYGFPVGGVAATRVNDGVISPGGIGFDINCGVRLLRTDLDEEELKPQLTRLVDSLFAAIPAGVGSTGRVKVGPSELDEVLHKGAAWAVARGYGSPEDLEHTEEKGRFGPADPNLVSDKAKKRGLPQLGTLGSGNHFLEVQVVDELYRPDVARVYGVDHVGQVLVLIHTGSRGLGHQVCDDYLRTMAEATRKYGLQMPDRQLACAPFESPEGKAYFGAMAAAANFAWANRQCIMHGVRQAFEVTFRKSPRDLGLQLVYDVAHNIAKVETHTVEGTKVRVVVHRKGATRAFPAGHPEVPPEYRAVGQPVLIPGDMGRYSFLAVGGPRAMLETFGSTAHGAGRQQSRSAATRSLRGVDIAGRLASHGIIVRATAASTLAEEAPEAYKDVADVARVVDEAEVSFRVARMRPLGVVKG